MTVTDQTEPRTLTRRGRFTNAAWFVGAIVVLALALSGGDDLLRAWF